MADPSKWVLLIYLLMIGLTVAMIFALICLCVIFEEEIEEHEAINEVINSDLQQTFFYFFDEIKGNPCHSQENSSC